MSTEQPAMQTEWSGQRGGSTRRACCNNLPSFPLPLPLPLSPSSPPASLLSPSLLSPCLSSPFPHLRCPLMPSAMIPFRLSRKNEPQPLRQCRYRCRLGSRKPKDHISLSPYSPFPVSRQPKAPDCNCPC